jgi:hypothetical protein
VRVVAVGLALLAVAGGIAAISIGVMVMSIAYMDSPPGAADATVYWLLAIVAVPVVSLLIVAVCLWVGAGWARLTTQLVLGLIGLGLARQLITDNLGLAPEHVLIAFVIAATCIAAAVYLERPAVRAACGLERDGIIGQHPRESLVVAAAVVALLTFSAVTEALNA